MLYNAQCKQGRKRDEDIIKITVTINLFQFLICNLIKCIVNVLQIVYALLISPDLSPYWLLVKQM